MDKPSQTKPYAGLIIYRINRNVEYLLLNDSFTNKKHWFCPKGQVLGSEDEIKCALRETFEATGLRPSELRIEEGFAIELKYLSGTKPKKVKYHLAQLLDNHVRLLPNAEGVHMQWFNQTISSEKVIFKSMQDVFKHAQTFIESKQQRRNKQHSSSFDRHHSNHGNNNNAAINSPITVVAATPYNRSSTTVAAATHEAKSLVTSSEDGNTHKASYNNKPRNNQQQQQQQLQQQQASPLYKTRLCERFEIEGSCPYGPKCNFAHGIVELRGREQQQQATQSDAAVPSPTSSNTTTAVSTNQMMDSGNQLFKTRLCEKFMKEKFCQYGPKCHFAHGEHELKERPKKAEDLEIGRSTPPPLPRTRSNNGNNHYNDNINADTHDSPDQRANWRSGNQNEYHSRSTETSWRSNLNVDQPNRTRSPSSEDEALLNHTVAGRANRDGNWRSTTPTSFSKTPLPVINNTTIHIPAPPPPITPPPVVVSEEKDNKPIIVKQDPPVQSVVEELRRPAFVNHQIRPSTPVNKKPPTSPTVNNTGNKDKKAMVAPETTEKSWMKIVKLSKEEQDEINAMQQSNSKICSPGKLAQTESIIADLKKFFSNHVNCATTTTTATKGKLMEDVKEVTKIEMRNDLSKKQLLYILLVSLLEDTDSLVPILKSRDHLFKTLVKTNADQILLLKAWENFVSQRKSSMVNKTAAALSHWYDCEMIEEEAFVQWYDTLEKESALEKKSAKFIEWLNSSDDEED